jgi:PKD repeat protein
MFNIVLVHTNSSLNLIVKTDKQQYDPDGLVQVYGGLTVNGTLTTNGLVGIEVDTSSQPSIEPLVVRTVPAAQPPTVLSSYVYTDYVVPCAGINNLTPKFSFQRDALAYFNVIGANLDPSHSYTVYLIVNVYDNTSTPMGVEMFSETLLPYPNGTLNFTTSFLIPSYAALGMATVYANAYSNWPSLGGTPYCREVNAKFQIVDDASGAGQSTQNQSSTLQDTGTTNYATTFRLATTATPEKYYVYTTSSYQGQSASNSTTFSLVYGPPHKIGDLGGYPPGKVVPQFGYFDGSCGADDIPLFIECYRGTAPANDTYLGDLGGYPPGSVVPKFFQYDGSCGADDIPLFIQCYRGTGPPGPVAIFTWSPLKPASSQRVTFNASQSYDDKYGTITSYTWVFGDGNTTTVSNPIVFHTFISPENYTVTLTVIDNETRPDSTSHIISV